MPWGLRAAVTLWSPVALQADFPVESPRDDAKTEASQTRDIQTSSNRQPATLATNQEVPHSVSDLRPGLVLSSVAVTST